MDWSLSHYLSTRITTKTKNNSRQASTKDILVHAQQQKLHWIFKSYRIIFCYCFKIILLVRKVQNAEKTAFELQSTFCWNLKLSYPDLIIILPGSCSYFFIKSIATGSWRSNVYVNGNKVPEYLMTLELKPYCSM